MHRLGDGQGGNEVEAKAAGDDDFNPEELQKTREEELSYFKKIGLYEEVPIRECWENTQGSREHQVGRRHERKRRAALCEKQACGARLQGEVGSPLTASPPLGTLKSLLTLAHRDGLCVLVLDEKLAHLNGKVQPGDGEHIVEGQP